MEMGRLEGDLAVSCHRGGTEVARDRRDPPAILGTRMLIARGGLDETTRAGPQGLVGRGNNCEVDDCRCAGAMESIFYAVSPRPICSSNLVQANTRA